MHLDTIRNFEWHNEPELSLIDGSMVIKTAPNTDFRHDRQRNVHLDSGHFFFSRQHGNFGLSAKWQFCHQLPQGAQYGLMARADENNWCKIFVVRNGDDSFSIATSVTNCRFTDTAIYPLSCPKEEIVFRLEAAGPNLCFAYSTDGNKFSRIRIFQMLADSDELKVGAYICCSQNVSFTATLSDIEIY